MRVIISMIGLLLATVLPAAAETGCTVKPFISVPLRMEQGRALVEIGINRQNNWFVIDTGASHSVMDTSLAQRLGLSTRTYRSMSASDIGGNGATTLVLLTGVTLGGQNISGRRLFFVADLSVAGLLAADVLSAFDVDLDFAGGRMNLFARSACFAPPGAGPYRTVSAAVQGDTNRIHAPVLIDGKVYRAIFDTGASRSYIAASAARTGFGLEMDTLTARKARGAYGSELLVASHAFRELRIGDVTLPNPSLSLATPESGFQEPVLLGLEHLQSLRLFIAYGTGRLYMAPARQP